MAPERRKVVEPLELRQRSGSPVKFIEDTSNSLTNPASAFVEVDPVARPRTRHEADHCRPSHAERAGGAGLSPLSQGSATP